MKRQVKVSQGILEGLSTEDPTITVFRAVPFAKPPIGELRWRAPRPAESWEGVRLAYDFAPIPMQPMSAPTDFYGKEWQVDLLTPQSEDCLYLNVWTPALQGNGERTSVTEQAAEEPLPVMVWIYGGAYQTGSTSEKEFNGLFLARKDVVVVSIAYRLNVFGFFTHPDLTGERSTEPRANFGLLDQRAGIQWVKDNIAAFGGDPDNITIFGQSAGAASVLAQNCSPLNTTGMFHKLILQSGAGVGYFNERLWSLEDAQRNGTRLLESIGVESVEQARKLSSEELLAAADQLPACTWNSVPRSGWAMMTNWTPCIDGVFLTEQFKDTLDQGAQHVNLVIAGNTTNEFIEYDDAGNRIEAGQDGVLAMLQSWKSDRAYYYRFDAELPGDDSGAFHSSDLWFTFGTLGLSWRPFRGNHYDISAKMQQYWTNFARSADPNINEGGDDFSLPQWNPYKCLSQSDEPDQSEIMYFR